MNVTNKMFLVIPPNFLLKNTNINKLKNKIAIRVRPAGNKKPDWAMKKNEATKAPQLCM